MSGDLGEFFSLIGKAKQEKEDEFRSLVGDIDIDSIFKEAKKSVEEDKKKKIKEEKQAKALEAWLYAEPKVEDKKEEVEPEEKVVEESEDTLEIEDLYGNPKFEVIDIIKPEPLGKTKIAEEQTDIVEENDTIGKALNLLGKLKTKEEIQEQTTDPEIIRIRGELEYLKNLVNAQGGGGEVNLRYLDDIVGIATNLNDYNGKFLKIDTSNKKQPFVFANTSGGGGGGGSQTLDEVLTEGNTSSLGMNVGVVTATSFDGTATFATSAGIATEAVSAGIATDARGLTGTPNITVGNVIGVAATFTGNVSVGGTLNYEDVSNIDVVGLITARSGVEFGLAGVGGTITGSGDAEFAGIVTSTKVHVGVDTGFFNEDLVVNGDARVTGILTVGSGSITLDPNTKRIEGIEEIIIGIANTITIKQDSEGGIEFTDQSGEQKSVGIGTTVSINTSGIITATSFVGNSITFDNGLISSVVTTTTTTSESSIDSFSASDYRSAKYQIQITQGSNYHTTEVNIVHDGSDSYGTEYGTIKTGSSLSTFNTDISGGNVRLLATPASSSSTVFKLIRTLIEV
tara:strand:- start:6 stop:1712 length:1707 start_codon:yes stop_codon:yes gene_type:complete